MCTSLLSQAVHLVLVVLSEYNAALALSLLGPKKSDLSLPGPSDSESREGEGREESSLNLSSSDNGKKEVQMRKKDPAHGSSLSTKR